MQKILSFVSEISSKILNSIPNNSDDKSCIVTIGQYYWWFIIFIEKVAGRREGNYCQKLPWPSANKFQK